MIQGTQEAHWLDEAACRDLTIDDIQLFFVDAGKGLAGAAAEMCRTCPVKLDCLRHAYERNITGGFFGGLSPTKRRQLSLSDAEQYVLEHR